ncbi:MAG TPA: hypothetical protein VGH23_12700 [Rhizomicrobium sp.]
MTLSDLHHDAPNETTAASDQSSIVCVANERGLATVLYSPGPSAYDVIELTVLPGVLVVPKPLFGIASSLLEQAATSGDFHTGDLEDFTFRLLQRLTLMVQPESPEMQLHRVKLMAHDAMQLARLKYERSDDMAYSTELWPTSDRSDCFLRSKLSDENLSARYAHVVSQAVEQGFLDIPITDPDRSLLQAYAFNHIREIPSDEAISVGVFGLHGPHRAPTIAHFMLDGFVADNLKIVNDCWWTPFQLTSGTGFVGVESRRADGTSVHRRQPAPADASIEKLYAALGELSATSAQSSIAVDALVQFIAEVRKGDNLRLVWGDQRPPPEGFATASPEALLEVATLLARASVSINGLGDLKHVISAIAIAK